MKTITRKTITKPDNNIIDLVAYMKRKERAKGNSVNHTTDISDIKDVMASYFKNQKALSEQRQAKGQNEPQEIKPMRINPDPTQTLPEQIVTAIFQIAEVAKTQGKLQSVILLNLTDLQLAMQQTQGEVSQVILYYATRKPAVLFSYDQKNAITLTVIDPKNRYKAISTAKCLIETDDGSYISGERLIKILQSVAINNVVCALAK